MARKVACRHGRCSGALTIENVELYAILVCDLCDEIIHALPDHTDVAREQRSASPILAIAGGKVKPVYPKKD